MLEEVRGVYNGPLCRCCTGLTRGFEEVGGRHWWGGSRAALVRRVVEEASW